MRYTIDRFEGKCAIVELDDSTMAVVEIRALPAGVKEGDVVRVKVGESQRIGRERRMAKKMNRLFARR